MSCEICQGVACSRMFHSIKEQEEFDKPHAENCASRRPLHREEWPSEECDCREQRDDIGESS